MINRKPLVIWRKLALSLMLSSAIAGPALAQMGPGFEVEKTYGQGLPRDADILLFDDDQYSWWPLTEEQQRYAPIDGMRMKEDVEALADIARTHRDEGAQWWGRFPGTVQDDMTMDYVHAEFERLGLTIEEFEYELPHDWRGGKWEASYEANGTNINLTTVFPVADSKETDGETVTAEAIWVGVGSEADFAGRDVAGKAVVIYSFFVPGGRSHSASDRAGIFNANSRAVELGAAMVINVMGLPGNGQYQPEGGLEEVPHFTLSQDEGFALRDRLGAGETVTVSYNLDAEHLENVKTSYSIATLPGVSEEEILIMAHTDGFFEGATDNGAGVASMLEMARFYSSFPEEERPRTMRFLTFTDHHHGEVARGREDVGINATYDWDNVAVKLTMEHPSQTLLYLYNENLTPTNAVGAFRWNALGSPEFEEVVFNTFRDFGVNVYAQENGPKNGAYAPSFHIIDHVIYHTSLDTPELVPAAGLQNATQAFAAIVDQANEMTMEELRGEGWPYETGQGSLIGNQKVGEEAPVTP